MSDASGATERIRRQLARERRARAQAEEIAEKTTRDLYEANLELQRANRDLEQFAHIASHDLQEPLRMVASFTQLIGKRYRGKLDADADEFIDYAVNGARRMQAMINGLLEYSRLSRTPPSSTVTDVNEVCRRAIENLKGSIEECGAIITRDELPRIRAGPTELERLFQNLIGNAIKFRGSQAPRIHVSVEREYDSWRFSVRDNGIGIRVEDRERIFGMFRRLNSGDAYPGNGIGLAIAKRIVERHGGRIWLDTAPGQGSTFQFTLPAIRGVVR